MHRTWNSSERRAIRREIQHLTRRTWIVLTFVVIASLLFAAVTRSIHLRAKETPHVAASR